MPIFEKKQYCSTKQAWYLCGKKIASLPACRKNFLSDRGSVKFGVSYSVFDGEELLEESIKSIRQQVDYVNVVYQFISWRGSACDANLLNLLQDLQQRKLIDELIFFEPDLKKSPQINETEKRNIGLQAALKAGVNYFMTMDVDEFYRAEEVQRAKKIILEKQITHSYCPQIIYVSSTQRLLEHDRSYVPFFGKVDKFSKLGANEFAPCLSDPTRKLLERKCSKHYVLNGIAMHHFTKVRKDIDKKNNNSSLDKVRGVEGEVVEGGYGLLIKN